MLIALIVLVAALAVVTVSIGRAPKAIPIRVRNDRRVRVVRRD